MRDYMDRRVTQPKAVTSLTWGPPPPCKQALDYLFPLPLWLGPYFKPSTGCSIAGWSYPVDKYCKDISWVNFDDGWIALSTFRTNRTKLLCTLKTLSSSTHLASSSRFSPMSCFCAAWVVPLYSSSLFTLSWVSSRLLCKDSTVDSRFLFSRANLSLKLRIMGQIRSCEGEYHFGL